ASKGEVYSVEFSPRSFRDLVKLSETRPNVLLTKTPAGYPHDHGEGDATLAGAIFKFSYYDGQYSTAAAAEGSGNATATWHFVTDTNGKINGQSPVKADGKTNSAFYKDKDGKICYPLGTYVIQEVTPSTGYLLNNEKLVVHITEDGTDNLHVKTYNESIKGDETIIRGGVKLAKIDNDLDEAYAQGDATLEGAEFTIYNKSKESIMVNGKEIAVDGAALVITTNTEGIATSAQKVLPYGSYLVKETKPSKGYLLNEKWSRAFRIRTDGEMVDLTADKVREAVERGGVQIIKRDKELKKSEALGGATLNGIVMTIKNVSGHDVVVRKDLDNKTDKINWKELKSRKELFEAGTIKRVKSGEDVGKITVHWNADKKAYTAETLSDDLPYGTYTIRESKTNDTYQRTDKTEHMFEVREDGTIYSYDDGSNEAPLTFDNYVYRSDVQGTKIGDGDSKRFSFVPFKIISVTNEETHVVVTDKNGFFSTKDRRAAGDLDEDEDADTARVQNPFDDLLEAKDIKTEDLQKRAQQILQGVWFGTGEFGSKAAMNSSFGALPYDSYILEEMSCEANEGYSLQRFYFTVDQKSQNGFVDLETITDDVPEIGTIASVNGIKENVLPKKEIELTDVIEYKGLKKGETYTAKGKLMDKATGEVIKDSSGKEITAERPFTAPAAEGRAFVTFMFDGSDLGGKETVVFETLYDAQGHLTAKHEDINDEGQTVTWKKPEIGTTLTDQKNNKSVVTSEKTILIDTVEYKGLDTSQWYVVYGTLMVKDTGDPLVENGTPVAAMSKPFKPILKNGKVKVEFEISTKGLEGKELVAFETAYRLEGYKKGDDVSKTPGVIIAEHKDLKDKGQTIKVVKPGTPIEHSPKTGDNVHIALSVALMLLAAEVGYVLFKRRKAAKTDDDDDSEEIVE
ncbi:MAG: VaFE repeat-containing surface-anchored protein, partial [Erysipelotrichaceae bacterium]|nr:VaFE repeat-containing surface-anchored protein [Erysipelotrichaceae bacterium]